MPDREPVTQAMSASEARQQWGQLLNRVFHGQTRVIVKKGDVALAAIISADDLERFNRFEQQRAERFKALDDTRQVFQDVPDDELEREVARAIEQVRSENRQRAQR